MVVSLRTLSRLPASSRRGVGRVVKLLDVALREHSRNEECLSLDNALAVVRMVWLVLVALGPRPFFTAACALE